jgi:hypothetical protein
MIFTLLTFIVVQNKAMERLSEVDKKERESLMLQFETDKKELMKQIITLQSQVTTKSSEVVNEVSRNRDLRNQLQQAHLELQETQISLTDMKFLKVSFIATKHHLQTPNNH